MDNFQQDAPDNMRLDGLLTSQVAVEPEKKDRSWFIWAALLGSGVAVLLALATML